jgi:hypothetical protein
MNFKTSLSVLGGSSCWNFDREHDEPVDQSGKSCHLNMNGEQAPVPHTCNPSYSGGRDQEDHGLKPALTNSPQDPISNKPITKEGLVEGLKV